MALTVYTSEIWKKSTFTRVYPKNIYQWPKCFQVKDKIIGDMHGCVVYGTSIFLPKGYFVLIKVWTYLIKPDGRNKSCNFCNESVISRRNNNYAQTYAACASQVVMSLFTS